MTANIIASIVLALIIGGAVAYIVKSKKSGRKCIGCPGGACCHCTDDTKNRKHR